MPRGNVRVSITGETAGLQRATSQAERSLGRLNREGTKHAHSLAGSVSRLALSFAGPAGLAIGLGSVVEAAAKAEKAQAKLETQLKAVGISYKAHAKQIDEVIKKTSELSGLDDEDLKDSFVNIVRVTGDVNKSLRLTGLAADFARAKHLDVAKAGELVGKVAGGNIGILSRYGITIKKGADSTEALGILQKKFAGQAEAYGKTTAGAVDRSHVAFENLREVIGSRITPILTKLANRTADFVNQMVDGTGAGGRFAAKLKDIADAVRPIVKFFTDHPKLIAVAVGAWATYRIAAAAALTATRLKLIGTFLGLGPRAAAGGAVAGNAFGTAANARISTKLRGVKWGGLGSLIGRAFGLAFGAAAAVEISGAIGKALNFNPGAATGGGGGIKIGFGGTPGIKQVQDFVKGLGIPGLASGGYVEGPAGAGDVIPAMLKPGEVVLNRRQQRMVGPRRVFDVLNATGAKVIGPGARAATGGYAAMVRAANSIDGRHYPYRWGGGHNSSFSGPYDCSGAVSAVLHAGGVLSSPLVSGQFANWGDPGPGKVTLYANSGHVYMRLGSNWFGTSRSNPGGGAGWFPGAPRPGFAVRHVPERLLGGKGAAGDGTDRGVVATGTNSKGKITGSSSAGFPSGAGGQITSFGNYVGGLSPITGKPLIGGSMGDLGVSTAPAASPYDPGTSSDSGAPDNSALIAAIQSLKDQLASNQAAMYKVSQSQYGLLAQAIAGVVSGEIGGTVGLGFQTPSFAGGGARY